MTTQALGSIARFAAIVAAAIALALNVAASITLFEPQTTFGYRLVYTKGFEVAEVDSETSAARAGISPTSASGSCSRESSCPGRTRAPSG